MSLYKKRSKIGLGYTVNKYIIGLKKPSKELRIFYLTILAIIIASIYLVK